MKSGIFQVHCLGLIGINVLAENYQNDPKRFKNYTHIL